MVARAWAWFVLHVGCGHKVDSAWIIRCHGDLVPPQIWYTSWYQITGNLNGTPMQGTISPG